ncbi:MAG: hypothetical protein R2726_17640 [Acidimicrobiales bacterium]
MAPTLTALDTQAGSAMPFLLPSLPDATTGAMPADRRASNGPFWASKSQGPGHEKPPRLMLAAAIDQVDRSEYTKSRPRVRSKSKNSAQGPPPAPHAEPVTREKTCTEMIDASGATPVNEALRPAVMPATWVPWVHEGLIVHGAPDPGPVAVVGSAPGHTGVMPAGALSVEKQASATTLPARNGCEESTPVSSTATVWPAPV